MKDSYSITFYHLFTHGLMKAYLWQLNYEILIVPIKEIVE